MKRKNKSAPAASIDAALLAHLAAAVETLRKNGFETIHQATIFCAAIGEPKTLAEIVRSTRIPFSTASRVAYELHQRGWMTYAGHPTDRRKKLLQAVVGQLA